MPMNWNIDEATALAATRYPLPISRSTPVGPLRGRRFNTQSWNHRVIQPATWHGVVRSDPEEIIRQFQGQHYTQGLAMVTSWGTMWRQPNSIWGGRALSTIEETLHSCTESIQDSNSVSDSWSILRSQLQWSSVLMSKTLHFLCLSLGIDDEPPVPIDGAVIRQRVWPAFREDYLS